MPETPLTIHARTEPRDPLLPGLDKWLLLGLCSILAFSVLAFGSTDAWATYILELGAGLLFLAWTAGQLLNGRIKVFANPLYLPLGLFALLIMVQIVFGLTTYQHATRMEFLRYVAYAMLFVVASSCFRSRSRRRQFLYFFTIFGSALAILAILQGWTAEGKIYWTWAVKSSGHVYGPYPNHSNYAGLMEMLAPMPLILWLNSQSSKGRQAILAVAGIGMAATILLSHSRGGTVAFVAELLVLAGYLLLVRRDKGAGVKLAVLIVAAIAFLIATDRGELVGRFSSLSTPLSPTVAGTRLAILQDSIRMFRERPVFGWGLDVFPLAYTRFRSFPSNYYINKAHNDYAQLLVETGAAGFLIMLLFIAILYSSGVRKLSGEKGHNSAALAALIGCTGILVHSFTDFNLHIPANAALFYVLAALATTPARRGSGSRDAAFVPPPAASVIEMRSR